MALANLAWILASNGKRVLCLDWDLEAPGLHRYFHPFMVDKELSASDGLIDFVFKFDTAAATPPSKEDSPVYLSQTDSAQEPLRESVKNVLLKSGYSVVPDAPLPDDPNEFEAAVRNYLERSNMSVNLISRRPEESEKYPYENKQNSLARERSIDPTFSHLIWIPPETEELQSVIDTETRASESSSTQLLHGPLEEVFEAIREHARKGSSDSDWYEPYANILRYASSLDWTFKPEDLTQEGSLDLIPAGRQGPSYSTRVNSFNWQNFYDKLGGGVLLEMAKERMRAEYDYILIDSRTGVSDTSGVCTVQMPDILVVCLTFNNQSIEGAAAGAESVHAQRPNLRIFPVPTRVEKFEKDRLELAPETTRRRFDQFLDYMKDEEKTRYWGRIEIFYEPYYAYEEVLAVFGDKPDQTTSLLASIERLAAYVTNNEVTHLIPIPETEREVVKKKYQRQARLPDVTPSSADGTGEFWFYLSYSRSDDVAYIEKFFTDLSNEVRVRLGLESSAPIGFFDRGIRPGQEFPVAIASAMENSRLLLEICSPSYFKSEFCGQEFRFFNEQKEVTDPDRHLSTILPVVWIPSETPTAAAEVQKEFASPEGGLRRLIKSSKLDEYSETVERVAARLLDMAQQLPPLSFRKKPSLIDIQSAFVERPAPPTPTIVRREVSFIYVVAKKEDLAEIRENVSSYGLTSDQWRPLPATDMTIGTLSSEAASREQLLSNMLEMSAEINNVIRQAEQSGIPVILIIDAWSLLVKPISEILRSFDRYAFINSAILVVMNDRDRETVSMRDQLVKTLRETFPLKAVANDLLTEVGSEEEFRQVLSHYFNELNNRIILRSNRDTGYLDTSIQKPTL